ncbi:hypothetical protein KSS87_018773, partial [Heliosperma pusillum]
VLYILKFLNIFSHSFFIIWLKIVVSVCVSILLLLPLFLLLLGTCYIPPLLDFGGTLFSFQPSLLTLVGSWRVQREKMAEEKSSAPLIPPRSSTNTSISSSSSRTKLPDFKQSVRLKYVKLGYHYLITHGMYLFLSPLVIILAAQLSSFSFEDIYLLWEHLQYNLISVIICSTLIVFLSTLYVMTRP